MTPATNGGISKVAYGSSSSSSRETPTGSVGNDFVGGRVVVVLGDDEGGGALLALQRH